jgi:hypothetical protein
MTKKAPTPRKPYSKPRLMEYTNAELRQILKKDLAKGLEKALAKKAKPSAAKTSAKSSAKTSAATPPGGAAPATSRVRAKRGTSTKETVKGPVTPRSDAFLMKLTKEVRALAASMTTKEVEDMGLAVILMVSQDMALMQPGVDEEVVRDTLVKLHISLMSLVKRLLLRWKPSLPENLNMQETTLRRIQETLVALMEREKDQALRAMGVPSVNPPATACDNNDCQNKGCARHVSKWN